MGSRSDDTVKTSDISDEAFLAAVQAVHDTKGMWACFWELAEALNVPDKLVLSKARRLINRGVLDGCTCGCRGDFEIPGWRSRDVQLAKMRPAAEPTPECPAPPDR